jgi:predicted negative regulator of RcsB-dependent stress response
VNDLSEKEQIEALRAWWKDNGNYVVAGVIIGVIVIFGWKQYQGNVTQGQVEASVLFEDVMAATGRGNVDEAVSAAEQLFADYDGTEYAAQARLALARLYMDNGRDEDGASVLRQVIDANTDEPLSMVARLRLAKILLYQDKAQEVVDLLDGQPDSAFSARFSEALGDAYVALGDYAKAQAAYVAALADDPAAPTVDRNLVQLKINDLPSTDESSVAVQTAPAGDALPGEAAGGSTGVDESEAAGTDAGADELAEDVPAQESAEPEGGEAN